MFKMLYTNKQARKKTPNPTEPVIEGKRILLRAMLMPSNDYTWPFFSLTSEIQVGRELLNQFYFKKTKTNTKYATRKPPRK